MIYLLAYLLVSAAWFGAGFVLGSLGEPPGWFRLTAAIYVGLWMAVFWPVMLLLCLITGDWNLIPERDEVWP